MKKSNGKKKSDVGAEQTQSSSSSDSPMDVSLLERIVKLMAANDLNTVDVRDGDKRVILKRGAQYVAAPVSAPSAPAPSATTAQSSASAASSGGGASAAADENAGLVAIKSPMVGTFYSSPSPDAKPFVSVGSTVDEETDVCVIEAMKVFNNIKAETRGKIAKVLVTNGQTVEFGQPLFLVKP
ncbi:MAG TPA: acetyl-CoA carboxylase biotin carboxyl carrier protein [Tepidisphaeraceae bacterium]|jgi:acetyl-CoA carboxylase biotin carboxyl carrier protein